MEEAAKDESGIRQNAGNEVSRGLQHIYSTLAKARQAGEDEYGPKTDETDQFGDTGANNQSGLGDNTGEEGRVSARGSHSGVSERLTALSLNPTLPPLPKSKKDRIEALKQQGLGRRRRDKENTAASGSGNDTDTTESESDNIKPAKRKAKNVLTRMEAVTGPLSLLHKSVSERLKVKVWIRSANCIRGICTGYILAFDTHFNMVMADVDEVYKPAGNPKQCPTKKVRKKRKKQKKAEPMEDIGTVKEEQSTETPMDMSVPPSGDLTAECQVDGAADSSDSESEANSATTAQSGDSEGDSDNESSSQRPTIKKPEVLHSKEENDSTEGDAEEESDASSGSEEDIGELMARLEKLKHEYENLKTGETPIKQSPKDISSPSKGAGATAAVETRTEESTSRRRSQRLQSQTKPMEVGTSETEKTTRRHKRDHGKSPGSKTDTDSKTASTSRDRRERSAGRDRSASMERRTSVDEKYKSHTRKHEKTGSSHVHSTVKHEKIYPGETSSTHQEEGTTNTGRVDQQKSARLESMIANLKEHEQTAEEDSPSTDLRTKLRLMRESRTQQSKTRSTESDKTPSRNIRSQVAVMEHRRKGYRSSESDSDSEEERESRKRHSSDHERGRDDRYRNRSPQRDIHREPRKGDSKDRDRYKDCNKEREHERRREHEKRKEPERPKEHEEHDRLKKHEQGRAHERAKEHEKMKEYDRQRESERHTHREHEGDKESKRQKEYEKQRDHERQKEQGREHGKGKVHDVKREDRRGEEHQREHEKTKSRESYKEYDKLKESEGYSRKPRHSEQETHRKVHTGDDKRASSTKDDAHKSRSKVKRPSRFEEDKTSGRGDYHKEHKSKGDTASLSKYINEYKVAISPKPAVKQVLPGGHVTPQAGARTMKPSILEQLRGTSLGDAGLYQRHVKQMLIRGDNVVMVSIVP